MLFDINFTLWKFYENNAGKLKNNIRIKKIKKFFSKKLYEKNFHAKNFMKIIFKIFYSNIAAQKNYILIFKNYNFFVFQF